MTNQETNVSNGAESTLSSSLTSGGTTVNVTSTSGFPSVNFYAVIDPDDDSKREVVLATGKTATTLTVTRGQDGTSGVAHDSGAVIAVVPVAALWTDINDRVEGHDHSGGTAGTAIATGDLTGHDKAAHDALNINADQVDGNDASDLLARANHTGTQAISTLSDHNKANHDSLGLDATQLSSLGSLMAELEVDGSAEVASQSLTTSYAAVATVSLTIPAGWSSWKCVAWATWASSNDGSTALVDHDARIVIDGTAQQAVNDISILSNSGGGSPHANSSSAGGRRTGMSTTGSRDISLEVRADSTGSSPLVRDIFLYARAVRTS